MLFSMNFLHFLQFYFSSTVRRDASGENLGGGTKITMFPKEDEVEYLEEHYQKIPSLHTILIMDFNYFLAFWVYIIDNFLLIFSSPLGFNYFNPQNVHQGHVTETLIKFLKAREWDPSKAYKMVRYTFEVVLLLFVLLANMFFILCE